METIFTSSGQNTAEFYNKHILLARKLYIFVRICVKQNRITKGCSKLRKPGENGLNIRTNARPKWERTKCSEE